MFIYFSSIKHLLYAKKDGLWPLNLVLEITGALPSAFKNSALRGSHGW